MTDHERELSIRTYWHGVEDDGHFHALFLLRLLEEARAEVERLKDDLGVSQQARELNRYRKWRNKTRKPALAPREGEGT